jgi:hypothetical protein
MTAWMESAEFGDAAERRPGRLRLYNRGRDYLALVCGQ